MLQNLPFSFHLIDPKGRGDGKMQDYVLWLTLQGNLKVRAGEQTLALTKDDAVLFAPGTAVRVLPPWAGSILELRLEIAAFCESIGPAHPLLLGDSAARLAHGGELSGHLLRFSEVYFNRTDTNRALLLSDYYYLIHLLRKEGAPGHGPEGGGTGESDRLREIENYLYAHYREPMTLASIARQFYLSPNYFSKYFHEHMGIGFYQYLRNLRLDYAVRAMTSGGASVSKAALDSGFSSISAFNASFKRRFGTSPLRYLSAHSAGDAAPDPDASAGYALALEEHRTAETAAPERTEYAGSAQNGAGAPLRPIWGEVLNIGNAAYCLNIEFRQQAEEVQRALGFRYARIAGVVEMILHSDTESVSVEHLNFSGFNRVVNFLRSIGLKPFIELGRRPTKFNPTNTGFHYSSSRFSNIDLESWKTLVHNLLAHCVSYWGKEEVSGWRFEMWVQPSNVPAENSIQNYARYFRATAAIIQGLAPGARFGGPGMNIGGLLVLEDIEFFLSLMEAERLRPDFISVYMYPTCEIEYINEGTAPRFNIKMIINSGKNNNAAKIDNLRYLIEKHLPGTPLYVTEFNAEAVPRSAANETCYTSAFVAKTAIDLTGKVDVLGYWQLSDLPQEHIDFGKIIFGGSGMISRDGIQKSTFFAHWLLKKLGGELLDRGSNHIATRKAQDEYAILAHNYKELSSAYCTEYFKSDEKLPDSLMFHDVLPMRFCYALTGITAGSYIVRQYVLNARHGNLANTLLDLNHWEYAQSEELKYLSRICVPREQIFCVECGDTLRLEATLEAQEVTLFHIVKRLR